ncbi:hypothetical protein [Dyella sp.]|uniref:hypothetical protein n=1 Tax=Dyella sp. TaxID=1869338 RepID=UPI002849873B|nr:hypothetical protein [Dyella sp.]MDR3445978.1 hypothetical protein [Dyella sp.]
MGTQNALGPLPGGNTRTLNITAATAIKVTAGRLYTVAVVVAGTAAGAVYDGTLTTGNTAANQIGTIPDVVGQVPFFGFPTSSGIVVIPGAGQTLAVSWS